MITDSILDDLWSGEKAIALFVHTGRCYWLVDHKYNFTLDAEKSYRTYLQKGHITIDQYESACREFRGGVLRLTKETFGQYLDSSGESRESSEALGALLERATPFDMGFLISAVERYYLTGDPVGDDLFRAANLAACMLPSFYVNFDRKIFMHLDVGRSHEDFAYADWYAKSGDFLFLIPDAERYWLSHGDVWKLRFL